MKHGWQRVRSFLVLVLVLVLCGIVPESGAVLQLETAQADTTATAAYGMATADNVVVRKQASTSANYWFRINTGFVCEILDTVVKNDTTWYKVNSTNPTPNGRTYIGYVRATYFRPLTADETASYLAGTMTSAPAATATPAATSSAADTVVGTGKITASGTNLRAESSLSGGVLGTLNRDTVVTLLSIPDVIDSSHWYKVSYNGQIGYVQANFISVMTSVVTAVPSTVYGTVKLLYNTGNLRNSPNGETKAVWQGLGTTLTVAGLSTDKGGYTWYPVYYGTNNTVYYVRADIVTYTAGTSPSSATATPQSGSTYGYVITTQANVNLRLSPSGETIVQVPRNVVLACIGNPVTPTGSSYTWYYVRYNNMAGYLRGDCVVVCDQNGYTPGTATATPAATAAPTAAPTVSTYVKLVKTNVNLRTTPAGRTQGQYTINLILPVIGSAISSGKYNWYYVRTPDGKTGYMRSDCVVLCDVSGNPATDTPTVTASAATATPTPVSVLSSYVQTTLDYVNLRKSASRDATSVAKVRTGTVLAYNASTTSGTSTWYRVVYNSSEVWILGSCVKVMTQAEYEAYIAAHPSAATPQPDAALGTVTTTKGGVNIRATANGSNILTRVDKGVQLSYYAENIKAGGYTWYRIRTSSGVDGYIRSDMVTKASSSTPTATPSGGSTTPVEATYTTLRLGSTGDAVKNLVQELANQGYYTGTVTSSYTSTVRDAVIAFQKAKRLTVDGIAGKETQHALFGTVEPGTVDYTDRTFIFYPAEKIDWFTGGIQTLWAKGESYKVYDVKTGLVWWARRWSGSNHADVEPLTAADTAILCKIYGVNTAQEIWDNNLWQRRPCLVTIGTRTFACSLFGMPHNPDGDTIADNNMTGQICIHFTNSKGHESGKVDTYHQEAIQYAYEHCPAGQK